MRRTKPLDQRQLEGNVRRFILFRLFFSARFYYPVFTILFLDYGLSLEQFAILNVVWAITIVLAEVPSGALADILGRKRILLLAAVLMALEMLLLSIVPVGPSTLLFTVFLINRILSGLAEASASGADEALAYDSLKALGKEAEWPRLLENTTRVLSVGFFITMITGSIVYDAETISKLGGLLGLNISVKQDLAIRFPVFLCLGTSLLLIITTIGFREVPATDQSACDEAHEGLLRVLVAPFKRALASAKWTINHRFILLVILAALALDSVARQFVVLASEYYRTIEIPTAFFGAIGAGMSLMGIVHARISRLLVTRYAPTTNFLILGSILFLSLCGLMFAIPWVGILFAVGAFAMMGMVSFQSSYYINLEADSSMRATILSFRGLALNLGLGLASLFYTFLISTLKARGPVSLDPEILQKAIFADSLKAFPVYFLILFCSVLALGWHFRKKGDLSLRKANSGINQSACS